jgi:hypothetical protein
VLARWLLALVSSALVPLAPRVAWAEDDPFELLEVASDGRTVAAEIADFDGDGRADLLQIVFAGAPPTERRRIRLWTQGEGGAGRDAEVRRGRARGQRGTTSAT